MTTTRALWLRLGVMSALLAVFALTVLLRLASPKDRIQAVPATAAPHGPAAPGEGLAICYNSAPDALLPLAAELGAFAAQGLKVQIRAYASGFQALEAMLAGECALSAAATGPVSYQALRRRDFRILASLSVSSDFERILVRRDLGIERPADLRGRRIAVAEGTSADYFLDTYLAAHGLAAQAVIKVFRPAETVSEALRHGAAQATAHWEPHIRELAREFGDRARVLRAPGLAVSPFLLLVRQDELAANPARVREGLRALIRAEAFAHAHPDQAQAMLARRFAMSPEELAYLWELHDYRVVLDQPLLFILESRARWQLRRMPPGETPPLPNFLDLLDPSALRAVKPEAVTVID